MHSKDLQRVITDTVGRYNTDILTGWESGMKGKERIAGKLFDRHPPEHFQDPRITEWYAGYNAAKNTAPFDKPILSATSPRARPSKSFAKTGSHGCPSSHAWSVWACAATSMSRTQRAEKSNAQRPQAFNE